MNPRLIATAGPLKGTTFSLGDEEISIGREASNRLQVGDLSVSRKHCCIRKESGRFNLSDLESLNGTFVNGMPVKERALEHGDQVKIGDSMLLFLLHEEEAPPASVSVQIDEGGILTRTMIQLQPQDALYLQPKESETVVPAIARVEHNLRALLKITRLVNSIRDSETLQKQLLESLFEVIPADRGAILLVGKNLETFDSVLGADRQSGVYEEIRVSRTIVQKVLSERVAILSNDILQNEEFQTVRSLVTSRITSVLAAPLVLCEKQLGMIYLTSCKPEVRFDDDHLQLITAVASIAAVALENARQMEWLATENVRLSNEISIEHSMVGESSRMREVYQFISKAAPTEATVLIYGESGTGKELVARAIHLNSSRSGQPFVAINCAAVTETLLESELFGYEKGAFTGALAQKKGKLEAGDGGTVFLDEIGELAPTLQAKLLRVLQEREFERVGGNRPIKVDIRLIAATNKDLKEAIKVGAFRNDLYYRLNVVSVRMPPLRERREDIPLLVNYFVAKYGTKAQRRVLGISAQARMFLEHYDWPGNVRELENTIERAIVLGSTELIMPEDLPEDLFETEAPTGVPFSQYHEAVKETKKRLILNAVEQANGIYTEAAKLLGVHPNYLHRLIRNLDLKTTLRKGAGSGKASFDQK